MRGARPGAAAPGRDGARLPWLIAAFLLVSLVASRVEAQIEAPGPPTPVVGPSAPTGTEKTTGAAKPAPASHGGLDLSKIETRDLKLLYFDPAETYLTPYVARALENSMAFQKRIYGWKPWDRTTVLMKDFSDYANAGARASPNSTLLIDIAPLSQTFETLSAGERFFTLADHELTHVATMDVWNSDDARWRHFFHGKPTPLEDHPESILYNYLATPRVNAPRWYLEGSAVFMETWMAGGFGRAQGGYDEMVFRAMVRDHARFFSPLGLEAEGTSIDFQVGANDYLYGTRFISYLALSRSPEKVVQWLRRDEGSAPYYSTQFKRVFGENLNDAWKDWVVWEHTFEEANLASVQAFPTTPTQRLTSRALGSVSRSFFDPTTDSLIGAFRYPGVLPHVGVLSLKTGDIRRLTDIKGSMLYKVTALAYDPSVEKVWYTADNYAYRDLMEVDLKSGHTRMLIRDGRIGDIVINPKDHVMWGLRHLNGLVTLVKLPPPYTDWNQVHTFPYGEIPFDLDISPDGALISASVGEVNGDQFVRVFKLEDLGDPPPQPVAELKLGASTPEGFVFSPDGRYLYGTSYYTGVSNIYRFEVATQKVEAVSNAATGLFRPMPQADGSLIAYEFTGQGFVPVKLDPKPLDDLGAIKFLGAEVAREHPVVKTWGVGSPAQVPLDTMITERGKYIPWNEIRLTAEYPVLEGYKGHVAFGWHAIFEDPIELNQLLATISYSPADDLPQAERWHADIEYKTLKWKFRYWHNDANFYDLFGPTDRSRKGDAFIVDYKSSVIYDPPRQLDLTAETAAYFGLDTLPGAQNVSAAIDRNIVSTMVGLDYVDLSKSLGAVDYEKGIHWDAVGSSDFAEGGAFPKIRGGLDFGFPLPLKHASIWLYTAAGLAGGAQTNPLANFYLGSFGNNYVDDGEVKRYRQYDSFPGFAIDGIAARSFAKSLVELNLPPLRFSNIGTPSLFLSSARPAVFAGVMAVDPGFGPERALETVGAQVDWNFTVALRLPMVLSFGFGKGFGAAQFGPRDEAMVSLKIL
ncbi:MAG: YncE family protein [Caulobacterales bacterium]